tara:strand:- start:521 stop:739 length:219 start_codon:yes stop_codon:yes gene_type:complete
MVFPEIVPCTGAELARVECADTFIVRVSDRIPVTVAIDVAPSAAEVGFNARERELSLGKATSRRLAEAAFGT